MAEQIRQPATFLNGIQPYRIFMAPVALIALILVIVVPMPTGIMDLLLTANLALAAVILLTTVFVEKPLDFSVFPSLLLGTTLYRLVLNIASTRLILSANASTPEQAQFVAGDVIQTFATMVTGRGDSGSQLVVGAILFIILIVVQFVVITKGATRISEVAARFTLDAMPGKQMAIDADLNAGLINEADARRRREQISQEADFYGAMDGAAKFVRGDAIAGIIITLVNIVGGFVVGVFEKGWTMSESLRVFTQLTIGDGLVSQLPAFVISIAAGLIVTRSSSRQDLGTELTNQLTSRWRALAVTSGFLGLMAFAGLPMLPMLALAGVSGFIAWNVRGGEKQKAATDQRDAAIKARPGPPPVEQVMNVDTMELEVGYALVKLVDGGVSEPGRLSEPGRPGTSGQSGTTGDMLERITMIRRQLAGELGLVMPPVRIRDNMQLPPQEYRIKIRGNTVATGSVYPGQYLAMDNGVSAGGVTSLTGIHTREPAFGLEAVWIDAGQKQRAESLNFTVVDATNVLATHLIEVVKNHAFELLTREETANLLTQLKQKSPKLTDEVMGAGDKPGLIKPGELQKVLQNLLRERVPIRDMELIVETLGDWAPRTRDLEVLTEYVRNSLRRTICSQYVTLPLALPPGMDSGMDANGNGLAGVGMQGSPKLYCVSLDPALEDLIIGFMERTEHATTMTMPPSTANRITTALLRELQRLIQAGHPPVCLASPQVRSHVRRLIEPHLPTAAVLGYNEVSKGVEVESLGLVQVDLTPRATAGGGSGGGADGRGFADSQTSNQFEGALR